MIHRPCLCENRGIPMGLASEEEIFGTMSIHKTAPGAGNPFHILRITSEADSPGKQ